MATLSLTIGNIVSSSLAYGAIVLLCLIRGNAFGIAAAVIVVLLMTVCSIIFKNQHFVTVLAAYV
jgi:hypothetical protein